MNFVLDPRLAADCHRLGHFRLSLLLMMNDANYPWFILVPQRAGVREIHELEEADQLLLLQDSVALARALTAAFGGDKLNIAALGNVVPQLHLHHIVRRVGDAAWPAPVWGRAPAVPYPHGGVEERIGMLLPRLPVEFRAAHAPPAALS